MSRSILASGLAAVALVAMAFHVLFAQAQSDEQENEKAAVERTLRSYGDAFSRGELSSISQHCNVPFVVIAPQGVRVLATTAEVETFYDAILRDLRERGLLPQQVGGIACEAAGQDGGARQWRVHKIQNRRFRAGDARRNLFAPQERQRLEGSGGYPSPSKRCHSSGLITCQIRPGGSPPISPSCRSC